jgi:hypothetical protein
MTRFTLSLAFLFALPIFAQARQYSDSGSGHVIHTRRAPVVMHRALPPFKGQHVYEGRVEK